MRHLKEGKGFQKDGFRINLPLEKVARILYTCYINEVNSRGRDFIYTPEFEEEIWTLAGILTAPSYRFGILMTGICGNGKTTMLHAIRQTLFYIETAFPGSISYSFNLATSVPIESAKEIINGIMNSGKNYMNNDVLMIDDLGHEPTEVISYGMVFTPIVDLLERRYARQKFTIISTNLNPDEIRPKYKNRLADRFNEWMHIVQFNNSSFRE